MATTFFFTLLYYCASLSYKYRVKAGSADYFDQLRFIQLIVFSACCRLLEIHGLLPGDQLGLGRVCGQVHVTGPRRDERQPVGGCEVVRPMLVRRDDAKKKMNTLNIILKSRLKIIK